MAEAAVGPASEATPPASAAARFGAWLRLQLDGPGRLLAASPLVAIVLACLAQTGAWRRIDAPLRDVVARNLSAAPSDPRVLVVDVGDWHVRDAAVRAAAKRRMAAMLRALEARPDVLVLFDALLDAPTEAAADGELADALVAAGARVRVADAGPGPSRDSVVPPGTARVSVTLAPDADGVVRTYPARSEPPPLALDLARSLEGRVRAPGREFLVHGLAERLAGGSGPPPVPIEALAGARGLVDNLPSGAALVVGVTGRGALELDGHVAPAGGGLMAVPGVVLHARAADNLLSGRAVTRAGLGATCIVLVLAVSAQALAALAAGRALQRGGRRRSAERDVLLAALLGLLGLPLASVIASLLHLAVSPLSLVLAPFALLLGAAAAGWLARRAEHAALVAPLVKRAPAPLQDSVRAASLEADPLARLGRILDSYEDVISYVVACHLAAAPLTHRQAGEARGAWHSQHTLQVVLSALRAVDPDTHAEVQLRSRLDRAPAARETLRRALRLRWRNPDTGALEDFAAVTGREKWRNWFVMLRNALAHDTAAWIDEATAAKAAAALGAELRAILGLARVRWCLHEHRLDARPDPRLGRVPVLEPLDGSPPVSMFPWLALVPSGSGGGDGLFRYRGLADRSDWPERDGRVVKMVSYTEMGPARAGLPERLMLPLSDVLPAMPDRLRLQEQA